MNTDDLIDFLATRVEAVDPGRQDRLLTLAERLGCGVDMHTDESLDGPLTILQLAERTARWTHAAASAGHCSRLGTLAEHELAPVVDAVLAADIRHFVVVVGLE